MTTTNVLQYATAAYLEEYLGEGYALPAEPDRVLLRASEVLAEATFGRAGLVWHDIDVDHPVDAYTNAIRDATCAQVEFWMETGEEFDVSGLQGSLSVGRMQIGQLPNHLAPRARRHLTRVGLITGMVGYTW